MTQEVKVYARKDNSAWVVCPHCDTGRTVSVERIRKCGHKVKARCNCGGEFNVLVECRQAYRKEADLVGYYRRSLADEKPGEMVVKNISLGGVGFVTLEPNSLRRGDEVEVKFRLDDSLRSNISRAVTVRWIDKNNYVGCEFKESDPSDKAIGFYVMP